MMLKLLNLHTHSMRRSQWVANPPALKQKFLLVFCNMYVEEANNWRRANVCSRWYTNWKEDYGILHKYGCIRVLMVCFYSFIGLSTVLPCTSTSCANGGSCVNCVDPAGSYVSLCKCPPGFTGVRCETGMLLLPMQAWWLQLSSWCAFEMLLQPGLLN